ncbi:MAG: AI-2E family transporter [Ignavibacteriae bacterium]|nr:AI-2E family transporter [Ignavibacteriota bacterium]
MKKQLVDPSAKFFIVFIGLVVLLGVLKELQDIFIPLTIAYLLVFVFEPMNDFLIKRKIPKSLTTFLDLLIIIGFFWALSTFIIDSFSRLGEELPQYEERLNNIVKTSAANFGIVDKFFLEFDISKILSDLDYSDMASGFFSSTISIFSAVFFVLFFFIFVNSSHLHLINAIKNRYLKVQANVSEENFENNIVINNKELEKFENQKKIDEVKLHREKTIEKAFKDITEQIQRYIAAKFLLSLLKSVVIGIILWIFDIDFLIVWAVLSFFLNFIPNIGAIISAVLPAVMTLIQYESIGYTLFVGGIISFAENLIGNIMEPKFLGNKLGLNPLVILLSLLIWGYIWGIAGMFLSVPLTAVVKIILSNSQSDNLQFLNEVMSNTYDLEHKKSA